MTTIAITKDKVVSDSQATIGNIRNKVPTKVYDLGDIIVAGAGDAGQVQRYVDWLIGGGAGEQIYSDMEEVCCEIVIIDRASGQKLFVQGRGRDQIPIDDEFICLGSGAQLALGCLETQRRMNKKAPLDPVMAVNVARKHDVYTGGKLQVVNI